MDKMSKMDTAILMIEFANSAVGDIKTAKDIQEAFWLKNQLREVSAKVREILDEYEKEAEENIKSLVEKKLKIIEKGREV